MKKLLTALSVLALGTTTVNLSSFLNTNIQKSNILNNHGEQKTKQIPFSIELTEPLGVTEKNQYIDLGNMFSNLPTLLDIMIPRNTLNLKFINSNIVSQKTHYNYGFLEILNILFFDIFTHQNNIKWNWERYKTEIVTNDKYKVHFLLNYSYDNKIKNFDIVTQEVFKNVIESEGIIVKGLAKYNYK